MINLGSWMNKVLTGWYAWRAIDRKPITAKELEQDGHAY